MVQGIIAALPSIYQMITGMQQAASGKRILSNLERPTYEIPGAAKQSLAVSEAMYADPRMPGQSRTESQIGQTLANYNRAARETSNPLAGLAMAQANANRGYNDLATQSAAYQRQDQQNLQQNLGQYAQYQDQKWQMNKFAPYNEKYNEGREMIGASQQNQFGAANGLSSVLMQMIMPQKPVDQYQIRQASNDASQAQVQDSFITSAGKFAGGQAQAAINKLGLTPQMLSQLMSAL